MSEERMMNSRSTPSANPSATPGTGVTPEADALKAPQAAQRLLAAEAAITGSMLAQIGNSDIARLVVNLKFAAQDMRYECEQLWIDARRYWFLRNDEDTFAVMTPRRTGHIAYYGRALDELIDAAALTAHPEARRDG